MPAREKIPLAIISQFGPTHQSLPQYSQCFQEEWFSPVQKQNKTNKQKNNNLRWVPPWPALLLWERNKKCWGFPGHRCDSHHEYHRDRTAALLLSTPAPAVFSHSTQQSGVHPIQRKSFSYAAMQPSQELSPSPQLFFFFFPLKKQHSDKCANWHCLLQCLGERARTATVHPSEKRWTMLPPNLQTHT